MTRLHMELSLLSSVLSAPSPQGWQSHPCWRQENGYRERWLHNYSPHVFEGSVVVMVYITQYGMLMLYRQKCICILRCSKWQSWETSPDHRKKSTLLLLRKDVLPGPKELSSLPALKEQSHQAFLTILRDTQEGTVPCAGKALSFNSVFFLLLALT